jgi:multidrug efflux pump subunit AcrA (membrane-fusion protein)
MTGDPASEFVAAPGATAEGERTRARRGRPLALLALAVVAGALGLGIYSGIRARTAADAALKQTTAQAAVPIVNVVSPKAAAPTQEILLPGTTQAFTDAPIFARTSGYVKGWYFDIGAHVKQGQLLAEIETPEVDQQLQQARADLETAQANLRQAQITADRWEELLKTDSVSKQETDQAVSTLSASKATVDSNAANVRRLEQLQGFEKIYAPFDGVITARNVDIGVLINAGANTNSGRELFHMVAIHALRVFVAVPEATRERPAPGARRRSPSTSSPGGPSTARSCGMPTRSISPPAPCSSRWTWTIPAGSCCPGPTSSCTSRFPRR